MCIKIINHCKVNTSVVNLLFIFLKVALQALKIKPGYPVCPGIVGVSVSVGGGLCEC